MPRLASLSASAFSSRDTRVTDEAAKEGEQMPYALNQRPQVVRLNPVPFQ